MESDDENENNLEIAFTGICGPRNPGGSMAFAFIVRRGSTVIHSAAAFHPNSSQNSNNVAQYLGFDAVVQWLRVNHKSYPGEKWVIYGDSQMVVNQVAGNWVVNEGLYKRVAQRAMSDYGGMRLHEGLQVIIKWIPRKINMESDRLVCEEYRKRGMEPPFPR